jgi:hypothetical protein
MKLKSLSYYASLNKYFHETSLQSWFMFSYIWFVNVGLVDRYTIGGCIRLRGNASIYIYIYIPIRSNTRDNYVFFYVGYLDGTNP